MNSNRTPGHSPRLLVVGGHSRSVGKTSLVVDLIRAFPAAAWTAVKITQFGHGVCARNGETCGCAPDEHTVALDEEKDFSGRSDSSRFLVAGARKSFWLRTKQGALAEGLPLFREAVLNAGSVIVESNSLLGFLRPELYLAVLDPRVRDFKASAQQFLDRADALVLRSHLSPSDWPGISARLLSNAPTFIQPLGALPPDPLLALVRDKMFP